MGNITELRLENAKNPNQKHPTSSNEYKWILLCIVCSLLDLSCKIIKKFKSNLFYLFILWLKSSE